MCIYIPKNVSGLETLFAKLKKNNPQILASTKSIRFVPSATFAPEEYGKKDVNCPKSVCIARLTIKHN
ncbi:hypothetical protein QUF74_15925 [Candidatus Halobeggiatoa sp. HSG11]|nr:hypothetical protein [Candidatus Halobeggiatoa sp. HSG11]